MNLNLGLHLGKRRLTFSFLLCLFQSFVGWVADGFCLKFYQGYKHEIHSLNLHPTHHLLLRPMACQDVRKGVLDVLGKRHLRQERPHGIVLFSGE
jgi:hypothetical protein